MSQPNSLHYSLIALASDWQNDNTCRKQQWHFNNTAEGKLFKFQSYDMLTRLRTVLIKVDMSVEVRVSGRVASFPFATHKTIVSYKAFCEILQQVAELSVCDGSDKDRNCPQVFYVKTPKACYYRCKQCQILHKRLYNQRRDKEIRLMKRKEKASKPVSQKLRREKKTVSLHRELLEAMNKCAEISSSVLDELITNLPLEMKVAIKTCHSVSQTQNKRGWILECLLLRIKNHKTDWHINNHNVLPVPSIKKLHAYLRNLKPKYGLHAKLFSMLKKKSVKIPSEERRGALVLDEINLSKEVHFLSLLGFTDLGNYKTEEQKNERGDYALVCLFQPFQGKFVQTIGTFLSKGAASGEFLSHIVLEAIIRLENSGFYVDAVVSDGSMGNRALWKRLGIDSTDVSCSHPCFEHDDHSYAQNDRQLWMIPDFSHLLENLRSFIMSNEEIMTPDGLIRKNHFQAVVDGDGGKTGYGVNLARKLTDDHLDPKRFKKIHVANALHIFSPTVEAAMLIYKEHDERLKDSESSMNLIFRFRKAIVAMTSRTFANSLSPESGLFMDIKKFLGYINQWEQEARSKRWNFMSASTCSGFKVSLKSALQLTTFLTRQCNFKFVMTARFNQDALQGLSGIIRSCCRSNHKPDVLLSIHIYRLLSFYSLVKPPKESYVEGVEILDTLFDENDMTASEKKNWNAFLNKIITEDSNNVPGQDTQNNTVQNVNENVLVYFAGFVARKIEQWTSCTKCIGSVTKSRNGCNRDILIDCLNEGFLNYPSDALVSMLSALEKEIVKTMEEEEIHFYTFLEISNKLIYVSILPIGCKEHFKTLTKQTVCYYVTARVMLLCKPYDNISDKRKKNPKKKRKLS